jgi:choloylglycine hydrolase
MCTNFKSKKAKDGSTVVGRSLEFPTNMPTALAALPSDHAGQGTACGGQDGKAWKATHGIVGMCAFGNPQMLLDGMNDAGLSAHLLYMPGGYCTYQSFRGDGSDLAEVDLIAYLLGSCSTLAEVKTAMQGMNVWGFDPGMGFPPPIHCLVHDTDSSIAIEFHPQGWNVIDNPIGVGTNAPYMDWHLTNLNNYVGAANTNPEKVAVAGESFQALGQGQGLLGLPGEMTAVARFVRAAAMVMLSDQPKDGKEAEQFTMHVLNAFDMVPGIVKESFGPAGIVDEVTVWDTIANLTGKRYAYRTVTDPTWYVVDLAKTDLTKPARVSRLSFDGDFTAITI